MKGDPKLLETLNALLADEITAISQYMVHSEMCNAWGYGKLHENIEKRAIDEMKHAEKLIGRILFLEGMPIVTKLNKMVIGSDVQKQFVSDIEAEKGAIEAYNKAIKLAAEVGDNVTKHLLEEILLDEDAHIDKLEEMKEQVEQLTLPLFLTTQIEK